jgi:enoyl-CoA hydratase
MGAGAADFGIDVVRGEEGLAWLVLRNPARLNAVRKEMWEAIPERVAELDADPSVRVLIVRGAGDEAFASGADISEFQTHRKDAASAAAYERTNVRAFEALREFEKPLVAMIHGVCVGAGLALAASADLRVAADDARFALPAARLGLGYHFSGIEHLVWMLGPSTTAEVFFTARQYDAEEALRIGLVNQVVPKADLEAYTVRYARGIAENAPLTLRAAKRAIAETQRDPSRRDLPTLNRMISACYESEDYAEGVRAFLEKRRPRFRGA